jgi:hypothetical protein
MKSAPDSETLQIKDCDFGSYVDADRAPCLNPNSLSSRTFKQSHGLSVGKMKKNLAAAAKREGWARPKADNLDADGYQGVVARRSCFSGYSALCPRRGDGVVS